MGGGAEISLEALSVSHPHSDLAIYTTSAAFAGSLKKIADATWISDRIQDVSLSKNNKIFAKNDGLMTFSKIRGLNSIF